MAIATRRQPRIPLEELCKLPSFFLPVVSWKGDQVAFYWDKTGRMELHILDLRTKRVRQVSHGETPRALRTGFTWTRDDREIAFGKDTGGNEQHDLFVIDVASGAVRQLTNDPKAEEHAVEFSPDDQWLLVNTNKRFPEAPDKPGQLNLWKVKRDGSAYVPLTRHAFPAFASGWSKDGTKIAYVTNEDMTDLKNRDGYIVDPEGKSARKVFSVRKGSQDTFGGWHPDSRRIAVTSDASGDNRAGILDTETGEVRWLTPEGVEEHALRFSKDGTMLACIRNRESSVTPVVYDVASGKARTLKLPEGFAVGAQFFDGDRKLLVTYSTDVTRSSLVAYDLVSDTYETLLEPEYGSIDRGVFVSAKHVYYPTFDGQKIPAILYTPKDLAPGEKLPAIVHVHGGPTGQWFRGFDPFAQFLVDRGYVVIEPNIRGSTGYGVKFRDAAIKDWGGADLEDVAAAAQYLGTLPYVDASRLVVFGGSYGGFMTFIAATKKPEIWRAAIAWVGISDLHKMWDESKEHFRYFLREQMGDPEKDRDLWRDRSAIEFADQLRAKLLMVHGVNDPRCPVSQSRMFRDKLLALGRKEGTDFEYVELDDEGHGSADIQQKIRTFTILADYLERALN
ncbi:MAG TPA: S9 family peptidase [Candidatus Acidoferrales bacterium]|nr:S9 family peptidase [Candidatus Acidoferrales bacterium]